MFHISRGAHIAHRSRSSRAPAERASRRNLALLRARSRSYNNAIGDDEGSWRGETANSGPA